MNRAFRYRKGEHLIRFAHESGMENLDYLVDRYKGSKSFNTIKYITEEISTQECIYAFPVLRYISHIQILKYIYDDELLDILLQKTHCCPLYIIEYLVNRGYLTSDCVKYFDNSVHILYLKKLFSYIVYTKNIFINFIYDIEI